MDIKALAEKYESYIIDRRRFYHTCPEPSCEEKETRAKIHKDLEALGITEITDMKDCYGLTAMIRGGKPGKTVALRADIDGLSVPEATGLPFASQNPGFMHACGHDNHIAMLLGAAQILNDVKDELCGNVKLIFQPAEEIALGALNMMKEHVMDDVDAIYGAHIWGNFDAPLMDASEGNRMACCHKFTINVEGMSSHASAPNLGVDAIAVSAAIINNLQQVVSRMNDPLNPLVLTIGTIQGGHRWNVTPGHVTMEGTVRTFLSGTAVEDTMRKIVATTAETFGATATLDDYIYMTLPVINDPKLSSIAQGAITKLYGDASLAHLPTMMGSEDFSWFAEREGGNIPYVYAFIGSRNVEKGITYTNHHEKYDVDESVLQRGAAVMAQFAADYLADAAM